MDWDKNETNDWFEDDEPGENDGQEGEVPGSKPIGRLSRDTDPTPPPPAASDDPQPEHAAPADMLGGMTDPAPPPPEALEALPGQHGPDTIPAPPVDPLYGTLIDERYLIEEMMGEGGMGAVYRATHVLMDKPVAIKLIHEDLAYLPDVVKRFEREARSASRLSDPHIITVTDFGRTFDGKLYLVMELLEGESLDEYMERSGVLPSAEAVQITQQILKGLSHAHAEGVVHRDLKPENVMLVSFGDKKNFVKILDFGIAKLATGSGGGEKLTQGGIVFGTPRYISPEQAVGENVDHRTDLYAVGILFYEMLAGHGPYDGETAMDVISKHISAPVPDLSQAGEYPTGLAEIVTKALAKKPDDRFASADEFHDTLERIDLSSRDPQAEEGEAQAGESVEKTTQRVTRAPGAPRRSFARRVLPLFLTAAVIGGFSYFAFEVLKKKEPAEPIRVTELGVVDGPGIDKEQIAVMLDRADQQIRNGLPAEAVVTLKELLQVSKNQPAARLLLGHAQFLSGERAAAMDAYQTALEEERKLVTDVRLLEHLEEGLKWELSRDKATQILGKLCEDKGVALLAAKANSALVDGEERRIARKGLVETGHEDVVDWLASLTADFHEKKSCKSRLAIIKQIEETADPRFLPLLEEHKPHVKKGGMLRKVKANMCIGADVLRAIETLSAVKESKDGRT
jgi:serine/threonine protein kinase